MTTSVFDSVNPCYYMYDLVCSNLFLGVLGRVQYCYVFGEISIIFFHIYSQLAFTCTSI